MIRIALVAVLVLSGCARLQSIGDGAGPAGPPAEAVPDPAPEVEATPAAASQPGDLGQEIVSLGDPTDPGLWIKTRLVSAETVGTVRTLDGRSAPVTLRPLDGDGGPQISLAALQRLGLPPAGLAPVIVSEAG